MSQLGHEPPRRLTAIAAEEPSKTAASVWASSYYLFFQDLAGARRTVESIDCLTFDLAVSKSGKAYRESGAINGVHPG